MPCCRVKVTSGINHTKVVERVMGTERGERLATFTSFDSALDTNDTFAANGFQTLLGIEEENFSANFEVIIDVK